MKIIKVKDSKDFIEAKICNKPLTKSLCAFFKVKGIKVNRKIKLASGDLIGFYSEANKESSLNAVEEY